MLTAKSRLYWGSPTTAWCWKTGQENGGIKETLSTFKTSFSGRAVAEYQSSMPARCQYQAIFPSLSLSCSFFLQTDFWNPVGTRKFSPMRTIWFGNCYRENTKTMVFSSLLAFLYNLRTWKENTAFVYWCMRNGRGARGGKGHMVTSHLICTFDSLSALELWAEAMLELWKAVRSLTTEWKKGSLYLYIISRELYLSILLCHVWDIFFF